MARRSVIAGNWKLYKTIREAIDFATLLKREPLPPECDVVVCAPFTALSELAEILRDSPIKLGAQDVYWENQGAFTGEVSAPLLVDAGCEYVIIGHSERRQFFGETDETVNRKVRASLEAGLTPIVCCGELLAEREGARTEAVLKTQIEGGFKGFDAAEVRRCVIAYEPVWAIGTGKVATPAQAEEAQAYIRRLIERDFGADTAAVVPILYGGSVKPENAGEILKQPNVDGALVGGASLEARSFAAIIRSSNSVRV